MAYTLTGFWVYGLARKIYGCSSAAFLAGLSFLLLPGVAVGSMVAATDALLLFFWGMALFGLVVATQDRKAYGWLLLSTGMGLGLLSKYTMIFFYPCLLLYVFFFPQVWQEHRRPLVGALGLSVVLTLPNVIWNWRHDFVTFAHTAHISHLQEDLVHPLALLEFAAAQLGVFGPLFFPALLWGMKAAWKNRRTRLLVLFSGVPLAAFLLLAFLSRALANWAAPAYLAATVLVVGVLLEKRRGATSAVFVNALLALSILAFEPLQQAFALPRDLDPARRMRGWSELGQAVGRHLATAISPPVLLVNNRRLAAELLYYIRPMLDLVRWNPQGLLRDTFDLQTSMNILHGRRVFYVASTPACPPCAFFADHERVPPMVIGSQ
jgi:4-amino-4-deoxy-L-arabinose transferase-like glycosyltransferase